MQRLIQPRLLAVVALTTIIAMTACWVTLAFAQPTEPPDAIAAPSAAGPAPAATPAAGGPAPASAAPGSIALPAAAPTPGGPAGAMPGGPTPPIAPPSAVGGPLSIPAAYPATPGSGGSPPWPTRFAQTDSLRAQLDALLQQESHTRQLMSQYSRLDDENQREAIVRELSQVVAQQFDTRQEIRNRELQRLEAQIRTLRDLHDKRARFRNEIIHERVRQLLRDLDGLGWGAEDVDQPVPPRAVGPMGPPSMPGTAPRPVVPPAIRSSSTGPQSLPTVAGPASNTPLGEDTDASQPGEPGQQRTVR